MSKASIGEIAAGVGLIAATLPFAGAIAPGLYYALMASGASFVLGGAVSGIASLLDNKGGISSAAKNPIGPWGYVYGYQIIAPTIIFEESNNSQGTSNNKELHRVLACACHPCQIGALGQWQLRINGKTVPMRQSGTGYSGSTGGNACATGTATVNPITGQVVGIAMTNGGSGYSVAPTVFISGGGGSGAAAVAHISGGSVTGVSMTSNGSGYYGGTPPYVSFSTPDGGVIGAGTTPNGVGYDSYSPTQIPVSISSISRASGVVTMHLSGALPNYNGQTALVKNVHDNSFNGSWVLTQPNPADATTFTYLCGGPDASSSGGVASTTYPDYADKIHVEWLDGNHKTTFPGLLASNTSWTANDLCLGRCVMYLRMGYDSAYFPYGPPNVSVVMMGKNDILDPRTSTRGYTNNAALCVADFMSMAPAKGGFGLTIGTDIPSASLSAAANVCDETINLAGGGTQAQYTCNTFFQLAKGRGTILQEMLSACAGRLSFQGGTYQIFPGAWVSPLLGLTDYDMYGGMKFRPRLSIRDTCNAVKGVYTGAENNWQQADIPPYMQDAMHGFASDAWLAEDRGERIFRDVHFPCTSTSAGAQRLAKIELLRTRYQVRGTIRCNMRAYKLVALDTFTLSHPRYGWTDKLFEVISSRLVMEKVNNVPTLAVELDVAETDPAIYDWSSIEQLTPQGWREPANAGMQIVSPVEQLTVYSGAANPSHTPPLPSTIITGADGVKRNTLWCYWVSPNDPHVTSGGHIEVQWKKSSDTAWSSAGKFDASTTNCWLGSVSDGVAYDVQARSVNGAGVYSDWVGVLDTTVSATQSVINGTDITYADGTSLESLKPAEPGAEQTTGKSIDILTDGGYWRTPGASTSENVVQNGTFEASSSLPPPGWTISAPDFFYDTSAPYMGVRSLHVRTSGGYANAHLQYPLPAAAGQVYNFSAAVRVWSGTILVSAKFYNGATLISQTATNYTTAGGWSTIEGAFTIPAGASSFNFYIEDNNVASDFEIDNVWITRAYGMDETIDMDGRYAAGEPGADVTSDHALTYAIATPSTGVYQSSGGLMPLAASLLASGSVDTNGTTTVTWHGTGSNFTTGTSWVGKRIAVSDATNTVYIRTIVSVTDSSHLVVDASIPTLANKLYQVYSDFGWTVTASGPSDVYIVQVAIAVNFVLGGPAQYSICLSIDGGSPVQTAVFASVGSSAVPYFARVTGLSAGPHSIVVGAAVASGVSTATANALIQRIY